MTEARHEPEGPGGDEVAIDLRGWLHTLRRHLGLIVAVVVIGLVAAILVVNDLTPRYTATSKVLIQTKDANVVGFEAVLSGIGADSAAVASQVEILTSRAMLGRVADKLGLLDDPEFNPYRRPDRQGPLSLATLRDLVPEWLAYSLGIVEPEAAPLSVEEQVELERRAVIDTLGAAFEIEVIRPTYVIAINGTSEVPKRSAELANALAELYIVDQLQAKFEATEQANTWLSERLDELRQQVVEAEALIAAYQTEQNLGDERSRSLIEQQLNDANAQLTVARSELAAAQANYNQIQALLQNEGVTSAAQVLANPLIQQLRQQEAQVKRNIAELSTRYGEKHPEIINAQAEIQDLQRTIEGEVSKIVQNLANEVAVARARATSIEQTVAQLNETYTEQRSATVRLRELEREAEATRQLYDTMLARYKETSEQEEIQQPDARIISEAPEPRSPSWPRKTLVLAAAGAAFLLLGIALAFLIEHLRSGFRSLEHAERVLGLPGLVEVPLIRRNRRKQPFELILEKPTSAYTESIRSVQTALALSNVDNPPQVVCLVSSVPEEGKSALAASLGVSAALSGRPTILVDGDLRRPQQHRMVGASRAPGLSDVLAGQTTLEEALYVDERSGLALLAAGRDVPNPHTLLQSKRMAELLEQLRASYELVLLDTPAIMALSDGLVLAAKADATMMLVQWERTPREVAMAALRSLRSSGAQLAGVILSQVDQKKQATYGYSPYGYYYGRYKSYYGKS